MVLRWIDGLGRTAVKVGADGRFRVRIVILAHERTGLHHLQWTANPKVTAKFLVVANSMAPGGGARKVRFRR